MPHPQEVDGVPDAQPVGLLFESNSKRAIAHHHELRWRVLRQN